MKTICRTCVVSFLSTIVLLLQISPALAFGPHGRSEDHQSFEVTFTKWKTGETPVTPPGTVPPAGDPGQNIVLMEGFTGGDAPGLLAGELLYRKLTTSGSITQLWPVYEVAAGSRSFTALIQGGINNVTGWGQLDGVIMDGWRVGARVQVRLQTMTNCAGAPAGRCFQGTIRILPDSRN